MDGLRTPDLRSTPCGRVRRRRRWRGLAERQADAAFGISREYQAIYGIRLVLLDFDLCNCFLACGETTTETAMLLAFVYCGAVLSELAARFRSSQSYSWWQW